MRIVISLIISLLSISLFAQNIISKDGVVIGDRTEIIAACLSSMEKDSSNSEIDLSFMCECMTDKLLPDLDSTEVSFKDGKLKFTEPDKDEYGIVLWNCLMSKKSDEKGMAEMKKIFLGACLEGMNEVNTSDYYQQEDKYNYCHCAIDKMLSGSYSYEEILNFNEKDNAVFNEVILSCMQELNLKTLCTDNLKSLEGFQENITGEFADRYCDCAIERITSGEFSFDELSDYDNKDGIVFKDILLSCINEIKTDN